jgi:transporter family protein
MNAVLLAIAAGLCWAVGELCTKMVLSTGRIGPITCVTVRCAVALPIMLAVYWLMVPVMKTEPRDWMGAPNDVLLKLILGSGVVAGALALALFYGALKVGDLSVVKPIAFTVAPAAAVVLSWLVMKEAVDVRKVIGVVLVLAGVVMIATVRK